MALGAVFISGRIVAGIGTGVGEGMGRAAWLAYRTARA